MRGDTADASSWIAQVAGAELLVDLSQPALPYRLTTRAIGVVAAERARRHAVAATGPRGGNS